VKTSLAAGGFTMNHQALWLECKDAQPLHLNHWLSDQPAKAVVMLAHGMAEHSGRYARLAEALTAEGIELYVHDQRGHGKTAGYGVLGHFADKDGWNLVVRDLERINHHIRRDHPQTPIVLIGHSMGSYIGMAYLMRHSCSVQGAIFSGSNYQPVSLYRMAQKLARFERWRQGPKGRSALIEFASFGSFNKPFKPNRTAFDWLSRDPLEVDKYINDPLCGQRCTNQLWLDLLGGLQSITPLHNLAQIDSKLPLLVIGGSCDPVSQGQRQLDLANALRDAGHQQVQVQLYPEARHELLNETNRDEATRYIIDWLFQAISQTKQPPSEQERQQ
jgi:alpha-beta hydrolase superfamily lysophospholipase